MRTIFRGDLLRVADAGNLLEAWREFSRGKRNKADVVQFSLSLMDNLLSLRDDLLHHTYRHGGYQAFRIADPKPRDIHKATVRDRVLHHAIYRVLYPFFDRTFTADSFSCRLNKGTHRAIAQFCAFGRKVGRNNTRTCWVLKGDVKKFFASINHAVLMDILKLYLLDSGLVWLLGEVIGSFSSAAPGVGLPLGNLTSQLLVNIYMNEFDQFVKRELKTECYIRYADDFVIVSPNRAWLERVLPVIVLFLNDKLKLRLHPDKVFIKTLASGVDFLGWVHFPNHCVLRASTKRRMFRKMAKRATPEALASYLGMLRYGNTFHLRVRLWRGAAKDRKRHEQ